MAHGVDWFCFVGCGFGFVGVRYVVYVVFLYRGGAGGDGYGYGVCDVVFELAHCWVVVFV